MFGAFHNWPGALLLSPASGAGGNPGDTGPGDLVSSSVARCELSASRASSADLQQGKRLSCHQDSSSFCTVSLLFQVVTEAIFRPFPVPCFADEMLFEEAGAHGRAMYQADPAERLGIH